MMTDWRMQTAVVLVSTLGVATLCTPAEAPPNLEKEVVLSWGPPCDSENRRLYIENHHTYRTAVATVRWKAAGGKELQDAFVIEPTVAREIGCAVSGATIVSSELRDF